MWPSCECFFNISETVDDFSTLRATHSALESSYCLILWAAVILSFRTTIQCTLGSKILKLAVCRLQQVRLQRVPGFAPCKWDPS